VSPYGVWPNRRAVKRRSYPSGTRRHSSLTVFMTCVPFPCPAILPIPCGGSLAIRRRHYLYSYGSDGGLCPACVAPATGVSPSQWHWGGLRPLPKPLGYPLLRAIRLPAGEGEEPPSPPLPLARHGRSLGWRPRLMALLTTAQLGSAFAPP